MIYDVKSEIYYDDAVMQQNIVKEYLKEIEIVSVNVAFESGQLAIKPELICAIIATESRGNPFATRFEPDFSAWLNTRVFPKDLAPLPYIKTGLVSKKTEMNQRATSFGLMQILGQTARENGFQGTFFTELCDVKTNLYFCIKYLSALSAKHTAKEHVIASYNAGSVKLNKEGHIVNQIYVDKVLEQEKAFIKILYPAGVIA